MMMGPRCAMWSRRGAAGAGMIEVLTVAVIVAVLAAVAVPLFVRQKDDGYRAQTRAALKEAATAMESFSTQHDGSYEGATIERLKADEGLRYAQGLELSLPAAALTAESYCIEASHPELGESWHYSSSGREPRAGPCP